MAARDETTTSDTPRKCPVDHGKGTDSSGLGGVFGDMSRTKDPSPHDTSNNMYAAEAIDRKPSTLDTAAECPVQHGVSGTSDNAKVATLPLPPLHPKADLLSANRIESTIPRSKADDPVSAPEHQKETGTDGSKWVYPSHQQFYNAMRKKGWEVHPDDIPATLAIHNAVNEQSWREVLRWEQDYASTCLEGPRLKTLRGRPKDLSPKARLNTFLGFTAPFDRHDWVVDRCGKDVRYVIDFYEGKKTDDRPAIHLDIRPALDSPGAAVARARMFLRETFGLGSSSSSSSSSSR